MLVFPATLSAANGGPTRVPLTDADESFHASAGRACSFELDVTPVSNNADVTTYPADANGDVGRSSLAT